MFRPQIQKTRVLFILAVINLAMVYIAIQNTSAVRAPLYDIKIEAKSEHSNAIAFLKNINKNNVCNDVYLKEFKNSFGEIESSDSLRYDPELTGLISCDSISSEITTGKGVLKAKQTVLKGDFAALVVDYFRFAEISKGDTIAVGMTGSMPGANIALLSACKAMDIYPVIISSLGASEYGATSIDFTWIDMEQALKDTMFNNLSVAYSFGGRGDCLKPSSYINSEKAKKGRGIIKDKVMGYNEKLIDCRYNDSNSLSKSIEERMKIYESHIDTIANYKAYVNIGGGAASIGVAGDLVFNKHGKLSPEEIKQRVMNLPDEHPDYSVVKSFADNNIPTINIARIKQFVRGNLIYGENDDGQADSQVSDSKLLYIQKYKLLFNVIALIVSFGSVLVIGVISHNQIKKRMQSYEPESIL